MYDRRCTNQPHLIIASLLINRTGSSAKFGPMQALPSIAIYVYVYIYMQLTLHVAHKARHRCLAAAAEDSTAADAAGPAPGLSTPHLSIIAKFNLLPF